MILSAQELCEKDPDMFEIKSTPFRDGRHEYTFLEMSEVVVTTILENGKVPFQGIAFSVYENPLGNGKVGYSIIDLII